MSPTNRPIYLDNHATTPLDPRVLAAMRPWWEENFANPGSVEHAMGRAAEAAVEEARGDQACLAGIRVRVFAVADETVGECGHLR